MDKGIAVHSRIRTLPKKGNYACEGSGARMAKTM